MRAVNRRLPELKIKNCSFKFFVNKLDALIQIESNNLGYFEGTEPSFSEWYDYEIEDSSICKIA